MVGRPAMAEMPRRPRRSDGLCQVCPAEDIEAIGSISPGVVVFAHARLLLRPRSKWHSIIRVTKSQDASATGVVELVCA